MDENLKNALNYSKSLSDLARCLFGKENYTNREKCKKLLESEGIDWKSWLEAKKKTEPKYCLNCGKEITGDKRKKFCCRSCSASYNNKGVCRNYKNGKHKEEYCLNCGKELAGNSRFCNCTCYAEYEEKQYIERWKQGLEDGVSGKYGLSKHIRRYLLYKYDSRCQCCGWGEKNVYTQNVPLQVHHIDGNCLNNVEDNLQLLCPNCHSLTENYGRLNKNGKRLDKHKNE
jgi:hypothetical protein